MYKRIAMGVVGAVAVAAGVVLLRTNKEEVAQPTDELAAGESIPVQIQPDRLRELGI